MRRRLIFAFIVLSLGLSATGISFIVFRPALPSHVIAAVKVGMTESEVRDIAGVPDEIDTNGTWIYSRFGNPGWLEVHFRRKQACRGRQ